MLDRLWLMGPLLYLGLLMAVNPDNLFSILRKADGKIRRVVYQLRGIRWDGSLPDVAAASTGERREARCLGIGLAAFAFMDLAGLFE